MKDLNALPLPDLYAELSRTGLVRRLVELARDEDLGPAGGRGDATSRACIGEAERGTASIVARSRGIVAGLRALPTVIEVFSARVRLTPRAEDGETVEPRRVVAELSGPLRDLLAIERTALNLVGRHSGVAMKAAEFVRAAASGDGKARVFDTRKTTPGLRVLEKYAVRCGGGMCHRIGLHDAVLIKNNHLAGIATDRFAAFVSEAAAKARGLPRARAEPPLSFVEVEVTRLEQLGALLEAGGCGIDVVLLDNLGVKLLREAAAMRAAAASPILLEASGGVSLPTIGAIAATGVDRISVGAMTHHAVWMDVAMDVKRPA